MEETTSLADRFWRFVPQGKCEEDCWEWLGGAWTQQGYPRLQHPINGKWKSLAANRVSWEVAHGPIPEGMVVCHRCDNPKCVNPHHLFLGTHQDNTQDMMQKGRNGGQFQPGHAPLRKGDAHPQAKLTQAQAEEIRETYLRTHHLRRRDPRRPSLETLAAKYGVSKKTVLNVVHGRIWTV